MSRKLSDAPVREMADALAGLNRRQAVRYFLDALLTPAELKRIALRWRLVGLLAAGLPQRVIASELGISLCKITRGSRELKSRPAFRKIVTDFIRSDARLRHKKTITIKKKR